jgi:hypothetical protein
MGLGMANVNLDTIDQYLEENGGVATVSEMAALLDADEGAVRRWARDNDVRRCGSTFVFAAEAAHEIAESFEAAEAAPLLIAAQNKEEDAVLRQALSQYIEKNRYKARLVAALTMLNRADAACAGEDEDEDEPVPHSEIAIYEAQAREDARADAEGRKPRLIARMQDITDTQEASTTAIRKVSP